MTQPGQVEVGRIVPGTEADRAQWLTKGEWAVITGDDCKLEIAYDKLERRFYLVASPTDQHAATDGQVPPIRVMFAGAVNQLWIEAAVN